MELKTASPKVKCNISSQKHRAGISTWWPAGKYLRRDTVWSPVEKPWLRPCVSGLRVYPKKSGYIEQLFWEILSTEALFDWFPCLLAFFVFIIMKVLYSECKTKSSLGWLFIKFYPFSEGLLKLRNLCLLSSILFLLICHTCLLSCLSHRRFSL